MSREESQQRAKGMSEFAATRHIRIFLIFLNNGSKAEKKKNRKAKRFYLKNKAIYIFWAT